MSRKTAGKIAGFALVAVLLAVMIVSAWRASVVDGVSRLADQVYISELNYNDVSGLDSADFLEVTNVGPSDVALTNWCLKGVGFCFTQKTILLAGQVIVVRGSDFSGKLNDSGELLQLTDSVHNVVDEVSYSSQSRLLRGSDGRGHTLHRRTVDRLVARKNQWVADVPSPGLVYDVSFRYQLNNASDVSITEINFHPTNNDPEDEFVEVSNLSASEVSVGDWCIPEVSFCFSKSDVLAPNEARVVGGFSSRQLSNKSDVLRLLDAGKQQRDVVYFEDKDQWPALADGHGMSLHRRSGRLWGIEPGNWEAKTPSPGVYQDSPHLPYLAMFGDVSFTRSPTATEEVTVSASMRDGQSPMLHYLLNFETELKIPMVLGGSGRWEASIPEQPAGTLVRFRLSSNGDVKSGSWPRSGDGMTYRGTVVKSTQESQLPQLNWFVEDDDYLKIYEDRDRYGDDGYPSVIVFDGEVFDRTVIRVRGNQSRRNYKRKWKVVLPAGYQTDLGGLLKNPVNEFALNSAVTDKSFVREILTSELQVLGGGLGQQVFPMRFEKNNQFYGLYLYQEQPDGRWRKKFGFSDKVLSFKSDRQATLNLNQLELPDSELTSRYQQRTQRWLNQVGEIRKLIAQVNSNNSQEVLQFVYKNVDVPQVIEAIATMRVAQHLEWEHKNHLLLFDPADEKWRLVPIDFDLNFGRRFTSGCNALCEEVSASAYMEYMEGNRLARQFLKIPELREMLDRRTRTLADSFLKEGFIEERIRYWENLIRDDAQRDRKTWYTYGEQYSIQKGQEILLQSYVRPKRALLIGPDASLLPPSQKSSLSLLTSGKEVVTIKNLDSVAIDISGTTLSSLDSKVPAGTVVLPGRSIVFSRQPLPSSSAVDHQFHVWIRPTQ